MNTTSSFSLDFSVRDYECDIEGIVNNSVYLNYFEHARHEYLKTTGTTFHEMHKAGIDPVVVRVELDYRRPLISGDTFTVFTRMQRLGRLRFIFDQSIVRNTDSEVTTEAKVIAVFLQEGRPIPITILTEEE